MSSEDPMPIFNRTRSAKPKSKYEVIEFIIFVVTRN